MHIIYGLSANPPTLDHVAFIQHLIENSNDEDKVIIIPNKKSPLKEEGLDAEIKIQMLTTMLEEQQVPSHRYTISRIEIDRDGPSYMIDTLKNLDLGSADTVCLALGLDTISSFTRWHQWEILCQYCHLNIYPRTLTPEQTQSIIHSFNALIRQGMQVFCIYDTTEQHHLYQTLTHGLDSIQYIQQTLKIGQWSSTLVRAHYHEGNTEPHPALTTTAHEIYLNEVTHNLTTGPKGMGSL